MNSLFLEVFKTSDPKRFVIQSGHNRATIIAEDWHMISKIIEDMEAAEKVLDKERSAMLIGKQQINNTELGYPTGMVPTLRYEG